MTDFIHAYYFAKEMVCSHGYSYEIRWQNSIVFDKVDESYFLRELGWAIVSSGLNEKAARSIFRKISTVFYDWKSASDISSNEIVCRLNATKVFKHHGKIDAIIKSCQIISEIGFHKIKEHIRSSPIDAISAFPYLGPKTSYHFAKNIGLDFAKPDRHLERIANLAGYSDVQVFCKNISERSGDSIPVVDIIFWRFATIEKNYLNVLNEASNDGYAPSVRFERGVAYL
jgi:endonuclease III